MNNTENQITKISINKAAYWADVRKAKASEIVKWRLKIESDEQAIEIIELDEIIRVEKLADELPKEDKSLSNETKRKNAALVVLANNPKYNALRDAISADKEKLRYAKIDYEYASDMLNIFFAFASLVKAGEAGNA